MDVKRGNVVLMIAPRDLGRPRPGIVVQADVFITGSSTIFVCPTTTDVQDNVPLRPLIDADLKNGLRLRSQVMTDKMAAIRREQIRGVIGWINADTLEQIDRALLTLLGLAR